MSDQLKIFDRVRHFQEDMENVEIIKATEAYGYYYATYADILKIIVPILKKHKIWYQHRNSWDSYANNNKLTTVLYCVEDYDDHMFCETVIDSEATIAKMNQFMVLGSAITYFKRYHLTTMLDIISDEDTDAGGKRVKKGEGRSIEAISTPKTVDFVKVFTGQAKNKTKAQFTKTFEIYKSQMTNEDIEAVTKIMIDKYGN